MYTKNMREYWWSRWDSNPRPPRCHRGALPTAPRPHRWKRVVAFIALRGGKRQTGRSATFQVLIKMDVGDYEVRFGDRELLDLSCRNSLQARLRGAKRRLATSPRKRS